METAYSAPAKQDVLGICISATSYQQVEEACAAWAVSASSLEPAHYICVTSVHGVMEARKDAEFRAIVNGADIATPDGMPLVWAMRSFGLCAQQRVYGPTLMLKLCEQAERCQHRIFLYGGRADTLPALRAHLAERYPRLIIAGSYSPPFRKLTDGEEIQIRNMIQAAAPHLLFVGISTPKQERWMAEHKLAFPGVIMLGVGAAFDFHAGRVKQAPGWMQRNGLEWLFRLIREPARLWRRYLTVTPLFLPLWAAQKVNIDVHNLMGRRFKIQSASQEK